MEEIFDIVRNLLAAKDHLKSPEAQRQLEMRALAARIKAAVATNPEYLIPTLEVEPRARDPPARRGPEHPGAQGDRPGGQNRIGVRPVTCEIHYRGIKSVKPHRIS